MTRSFGSLRERRNRKTISDRSLATLCSKKAVKMRLEFVTPHHVPNGQKISLGAETEKNLGSFFD